MSVGKYSPTVHTLYDENQNWFKENCNQENDIYDRDGYDIYGYNADGFDRAGLTEYDYMNREWEKLEEEDLRAD